MAILRNTAEGGTNGTVVSTGNTGGSSGDAVTAVTNLTFTNARAAHGGLAYRAPTAAQDGIWRWAVTGSTLAIRFYVYQEAAVTSDSGLLRVSHTTDTTSFQVYVNSANTIRVSTKGVTNSWTAGAAIPLNQWVRIEVFATIGTTTSNGQLRVVYYLGDSTTVVYDSGTLNGLNLGGDLGTFTNVRIGKQITSASTQWDFDDLAVNTGTDATSLIGPPVNPAPVVTITGNQNLAAGGTANVSVSATDDGSIASYAWSVVGGSSTATPTLTGASTAAVSFTVPAAGNLVTLQCVVTDNLGAATTVTTEVRVPKTGSFATLGIAGSGSWTLVGGAANAGAALADASDTTYVESPDYTSTESEQRWRLEPLSARTALSLVYRNQVTATGGTKKFRLYDGNVLRQEWTVPQHTAIQDDTFTVTSPGAISDWGGLFVAEAVIS